MCDVSSRFISTDAVFTIMSTVRRTLVTFCQWYVRKLDSKPLITQAVTTGFVCILGDGVAQMFIEKRQLTSYDIPRSVRMGAIGLMFTGPVLRGWFQFLDRVFGPTRIARDALKKVFVDQFMFAPILTATLLTIFGFSQGMNKSQVREKLKVEYPIVLTSLYKLWPAAQAINFYLIPLKFRVGFVNVVSLAWNSYIGYIANRPVSKRTKQ